MKKLGVLALLIISVVLTSCVPEDETPLFGTWKGSMTKTISDVPCQIDMVFTFYDDLTATWDTETTAIGIGHLMSKTYYYTYTFGDSYIVLYDGYFEHTFKYTIKRNKLTMEEQYVDNPDTYVLTKDI